MSVWYNGYYVCLPSKICGFDSHHRLRRVSVEAPEWAHIPYDVGSNPAPATHYIRKGL